MTLELLKRTDTGLYELDFFDDFSDKSLNRRRWIPYYLPQWSSRKNSRPRFRIENSNLILEIQSDQKPWCPEFNGSIRVSSIQTGVYSGELNTSQGQHLFSKNCRVREVQTTEKTYTPQYGYFEMKAKCAITKGNVAAFWMIGFEDIPEHSAEICIFELKAENIRKTGSTIGFGIHPFQDPTITDEFFEEEFTIDTSEFNVYAAEWTPSEVIFYINSVKVKTIQQSPQYPMQFMLSIYDVSETKPRREKMEFTIDYVYGYRSIKF